MLTYTIFNFFRNVYKMLVNFDRGHEQTKGSVPVEFITDPISYCS